MIASRLGLSGQEQNECGRHLGNRYRPPNLTFLSNAQFQARFRKRILPLTVSMLRSLPPWPTLPRRDWGVTFPLIVIGKSLSMLPFTVFTSSSVLRSPGNVSVTEPLTVLNSSPLVQSLRPMVATIEPLTVEASTKPVAVTRTSPFTV